MPGARCKRTGPGSSRYIEARSARTSAETGQALLGGEHEVTAALKHDLGRQSGRRRSSTASSFGRIGGHRLQEPPQLVGCKAQRPGFRMVNPHIGGSFPSEIPARRAGFGRRRQAPVRGTHFCRGPAFSCTRRSAARPAPAGKTACPAASASRTRVSTRPVRSAASSKSSCPATAYRGSTRRRSRQ